MNKVDKINLLPTADRLSLKRERLVKKLRISAGIVIGIVLIFSSGVLGYKFWLSAKKGRLLSEKQELSRSISQFSPQLELQQTLRFRLKLVSELISSRNDNKTKLSQLPDVLPADALIKDVNIKGNTVEIRGEMNSLAEIRDFEEKVDWIRKLDIYQTVNLNSLQKTIDGWPFSIKLVEK